MLLHCVFLLLFSVNFRWRILSDVSFDEVKNIYGYTCHLYRSEMAFAKSWREISFWKTCFGEKLPLIVYFAATLSSLPFRKKIQVFEKTPTFCQKNVFLKHHYSSWILQKNHSILVEKIMARILQLFLLCNWQIFCKNVNIEWMIPCYIWNMGGK